MAEQKNVIRPRLKRYRLIGFLWVWKCTCFRYSGYGINPKDAYIRWSLQWAERKSCHG